MNKELIKRAYQIGYAYGSGVLDKQASVAQALTTGALHTVPGIVAAYGSDSVQKDPNKYWERGKKHTLRGLLTALAGSGLVIPGLAFGNRGLSTLGMLVGSVGGLQTMYGTNSAIAGALAKHNKNKK